MSDHSQIIDRFEGAWSDARPPAIRDFLAVTVTADEPEPASARRELLESLVMIDLEYRWRGRAKAGDRRTASSAGEFPARPTIEAYLKQFPELGPRESLPAELIAEEYRVRLRWGDHPAAEDLLERFPDQAESLVQALHEVEDALAQEEAFGRESFSWATRPPAPSTQFNDRHAVDGRPLPAASPVARYRKVKFHRGGGLGQIWVARDEEVPRQVALKEIRPQYAGDRGARDRFLFESLVTGALEHPGIVPVYGLGRSLDGELFYAMRFIQGTTLREAIERFWAAGGAGLELRRLLQRFIDVCNVVEYAHSRGVIHRDLKPENVMLGEYGETLVVDWGLAKWIGGAEPAEGVSSPLAAVPNPTTSTRVGEIIGTPAYMSPEQAAGKHDLVQRASDVYSLGATLFTVLTDEMPPSASEAGGPGKGGVPAPLPGARRTPRPLFSICRKAMAERPEDRYASARSLAEEVENWLADEKVSAHRESLPEHAARWMRRHKTWTQAIATALALVAVVSVVAALGIDAARRNATLARREATSMFRTARATTDGLLQGVTEDLAEVPGAQAARRRLLERAAKSLEQLTQIRSRDPRLRSELAWSHVGLARLRRELNELNLAETSLDAAMATFDELAQGDDPDLAYRFGHATALSELGRVRSLDERHGEGLKSLDAAMIAFDQVVAAKPTRADYRSERAECLVNRAVALYYLESIADAERDYRRALADLTELAAGEKATADYPRDLYRLARTYNNLASLLSGKPREQALLAAEERCRDLTTNYAGVARYRDLLGKVQTTLGDYYLFDLGQTEPAIARFQAAVKTYEQVSQKNPYVPEYFLGLSEARVGLGNALSAADRGAPAQESYRLALDAIRQAWTMSDSPRFHLSAAKAWRGLMQLEVGREVSSASLAADDALKHLPRTIRIDRGPPATTFRDAIRAWEKGRAVPAPDENRRLAVMPLDVGSADDGPMATSLSLELMHDLQYVERFTTADALGVAPFECAGEIPRVGPPRAVKVETRLHSRFVVTGLLVRDADRYVCNLTLWDFLGAAPETVAVSRAECPVEEWQGLADAALLELLDRAGGRPEADRVADIQKPGTSSTAARLACDRAFTRLCESIACVDADSQSLRERAARDARAAIEADPKYLRAYLLLADCQKYFDEPAQLEQTLKQARTNFEPQRADRLTEFKFEGDYARFVEDDAAAAATAATYYENMLAICPTSSIALWSLMETYLHADPGATVADDDLRQAGEYAARLMAAHPGSPATRFLQAAIAETPTSK